MSRTIAVGVMALAAGLLARPTLAEDKVSPEEAKAAAEVKKFAQRVQLDEKHPDKPVVGVFLYARTIDEKTAALFNDMKHLKEVGGYDVKFKPGTLKLLKGHPKLETIAFAGSTDLAALKELPDGPPIKDLILGDGQFTAEHFEAIAKVPSLRSVRVTLFGVKPEVLRPLHKLKNLEALGVTGNEPLSAADLAGFASLKRLTCVAPNDSAAFFEALAKMKTLRGLTLLPHLAGESRQPPKAPPAGLAKLGTLAELTELTLRFPVGDANLQAFAGLKNLTNLDIATNGLTLAGVKSLTALPKLTAMGLSGAELPEAAAVELKELTGLKELRLNVGPLADGAMAAVGSLGNLESLTLGRFEKGVNKALPHVAKLAKLRSLDLTFSDLNDAGLKELAPLKNLAELKIGATKTTSEGQAALKKALPKLNIVTTFTTGPS